MLVWKAYDVKFYLLKAEDWMQTYNYDVTAKIPRGTTKAQMRTMLQNLLADRFHLVVHHETKPAPSYSLRVNKSGPHFKAAALSPDSPAPFVGDIATRSIGGHWQLVAKKQNMKNLAGYLMLSRVGSRRRRHRAYGGLRFHNGLLARWGAFRGRSDSARHLRSSPQPARPAAGFKDCTYRLSDNRSRGQGSNRKLNKVSSLMSCSKTDLLQDTEERTANREP